MLKIINRLWYRILFVKLLKIPLSGSQMFLPLQRAFVRCSGLYTPSDSHCLGFPNELKLKNGEKGLGLTNPAMQDSMKRTQNWFMLACLMKDPKFLLRWTNDARYFYMKFDGSEFCNYVTLKVQCCPYLRGRVRISFFVLHTINLYWMDKAYPYQALT